MATIHHSNPLTRAAAATGVRSREVLDALELVDRAEFLPVHARARAYVDEPIYVGHGQTATQPSLVARILEDLHPEPGMRVLEVGTGTGYEATLLGALVAPGGRVLTIERDPRLAAQARACIDLARHTPGLFERGVTVTVRHGDGMLGAPDEAPFDAIVVAAASTAVPQALFDQLADLGRLIAPIETEFGTELLRYDRHADRIVEAGSLGLVRYVPLVPGVVERRADSRQPS